MSKSTTISGFPEWLPNQKRYEDQVLSTVRRTFESHGFVPIETPAVELISTLCAKGFEDKEIFAVKRANAEPGEAAELALHFDLTVPFARYVGTHADKLELPFKRFQMQKCWRGERPQRGRYREFYQLDYDIVNRDQLPLSCDAEILEITAKIYRLVAPIPATILLNQRKIMQGLYRHIGVAPEQTTAAIRAVDKTKKIGAAGVLKELAQAGIDSVAGEKIIESCKMQFSASEACAKLAELQISEPVFLEGLNELSQTIALLSASAKEMITVDLSLARGLDYYTGIIFEVVFPQYPEFGSAGGGGRYENLVSQFSKLKLPGVGATFGLTRFMALVFENNLVTLPRPSLSQFLVAVLNEEQRSRCNELAEALRASGPCGAGLCGEVHPASPKLGKQIEFADKRGIPFVIFLADDGSYDLKDIRVGEQRKITDLNELTLAISNALR